MAMKLFTITHTHDHFYHPDKDTAERICQIERALGTVIMNLEMNMASLDDLKAAQADTDAKIAAVKTDVETMLAKLAAIPPAGMTPEQQAALDAAVDHAKAMNASLSAVDAEVNPVP